MPSKEIDRRDAYKKNKKMFEVLKKASGNKVKKLDFDPVALGIIKKKKTGGVENGVNPKKVAKEERRLKRIRGKGVARADSKKPFTGKYDTSPYNKPLEEKKVGGMTKKMNMGGVMKNRGGTFKGTF